MEFNATFLIAAVSFIVFVIIMNYIFYEPIEKIVKKREMFIDENFDEAKKNNLNSQKLNQEHSKKIDEANSKGKMILNDKTNEANIQKSKLISDAQNEARENILSNQSDLQTAYSETEKNLEPQVKILSEKIAAKLFGPIRKVSANG